MLFNRRDEKESLTGHHAALTVPKICSDEDVAQDASRNLHRPLVLD
jgi:hypothetical protein